MRALYVAATPLAAAGVRGCRGRGRGVSGVRVNPVNPAARSKWGKGWETGGTATPAGTRGRGVHGQAQKTQTREMVIKRLHNGINQENHIYHIHFMSYNH